MDITSPLSMLVVTHSPFNYTITATHNATQFNATDLPKGLSFDAATARISGAVVIPGTYKIALTAANTSGESITRFLQLTAVSDKIANPYPPVIQGHTRVSA